MMSINVKESLQIEKRINISHVQNVTENISVILLYNFSLRILNIFGITIRMLSQQLLPSHHILEILTHFELHDTVYLTIHH